MATWRTTIKPPDGRLSLYDDPYSRMPCSSWGKGVNQLVLSRSDLPLDKDTEVAGTPLAPGERVALLYPSGNRDELVFDNADRFLVDRNPNPHLAIGVGAASSRRGPVSLRLHQDVEHLAVLVDRTPQVMGGAVDPDEHLIEMPLVAGAGTAPT